MSRSSDWNRHLQGCLSAACVLEATARKPGNVHPEAAFDDVRFEDFVRSASVIAPVLAQTSELGVGRAIREAVSVTRRAVGRNTNLGIVLLLAPMAAVSSEQEIASGINEVLDRLTVTDARECFEAIRLATPAGLGRAGQQDVYSTPTVTLREAMKLASDRDLIARQYDNGFREVCHFGLETLEQEIANYPWETAIIRLHLAFMSMFPDSLIARKCGTQESHIAAEKAQAVLDSHWPDGATSHRLFEELDLWLREEGHRRNPGTTADVVAATLFAALRDRRVPEHRWPA